MFENLFGNHEESESVSSNSSYSSSSNSYSSSSYGDIFVVSIGGSVLLGEGVSSEKVSAIADSISRLHSEGYKFALVVGGGAICRDYLTAAKELGTNNFFMDELAIKITRVNATLLIAGLEKAYPEVLTHIGSAKELIDAGQIPVYGGLLPGATTDFVAALLAESLNGKFINLSNVDGIYSSDPSKNKRAKMYSELGYDQLMKLVASAESKPGQNLVIDLPACNILRRSSIKALFLNGNNLDNFENSVRGNSFIGTVVSSESNDYE
ncbi:MAG: UMP kinase [Candidatus Diapherotrites archaeon]